MGRSGAPGIKAGVPVLKGRLERMFTSRYRHNIDEKGRLTIPSRYRDVLGEAGAYITFGFDQNLMVLPIENFEKISAKVRQMSLTDPSARLLRRMIFSGAQNLELDKSGRILVSHDLREYAGLDVETVIVGAGDYFEIWSAENWASQDDEVHDAQQNAQRFIALELTSF